MRLLNISTHKLVEFGESNTPPYVIASHRWTTDEATYMDVAKQRNTQSTGYQKILEYCSFVQRTNVETTRSMSALGIERNCQWLWIDTACIDKKSSAELSESINSMFHYYATSEVCYAYLQDVGTLKDHESTAIMDFMQSEWFRRGWTLQELLAPRTVVFLTRSWEILGHKCRRQTCDVSCRGFGVCLNSKIEKITNISGEFLCYDWTMHRSDIMEHVELWMRERTTERIEDGAYCLLGLLKINLVPIYGERENAWTRLQEEYRKPRLIQRMECQRKKPSDITSTSSRVRPGSVPLSRNTDYTVVNIQIRRKSTFQTAPRQRKCQREKERKNVNIPNERVIEEFYERNPFLAESRRESRDRMLLRESRRVRRYIEYEDEKHSRGGGHPTDSDPFTYPERKDEVAQTGSQHLTNAAGCLVEGLRQGTAANGTHQPEEEVFAIEGAKDHDDSDLGAVGRRTMNGELCGRNAVREQYPERYPAEPPRKSLWFDYFRDLASSWFMVDIHDSIEAQKGVRHRSCPRNDVDMVSFLPSFHLGQTAILPRR